MSVRSALERYEDLDLNFHGSREGNLLKVSLIPKGTPPLSESARKQVCKPLHRHIAARWAQTDRGFSVRAQRNASGTAPFPPF